MLWAAVRFVIIPRIVIWKVWSIPDNIRPLMTCRGEGKATRWRELMAKIGIALGGGGAKGLAHIPALKVSRF
jgi:hypothetical protein